MSTDFVFVCFTCRRDVDLLPVQYAAIQSAAPGSPVWYAVDSADADMPLPEGSERIVTPWGRGGNLRGLPALLGILRTFTTAAIETHRTPVKIDSDIILRGSEWLSPLVDDSADLVGVSPGGLFCASGACYGISPRILPAVAAFACSGRYWDLAGDRCEDETLTMMTAIVSAPNRVAISQNYHPSLSTALSAVFQSHHFGNPDRLRQVTGFIDCGDSKLLAEYMTAGLDLPTIKRRAMETAATLPPFTPNPAA